MRKAADSNLAPAQLHLGIFYLLGVGLDQDEKQALAWIQKAAKRHYPQAEFLMGQLYERGTVVSCDIAKAIHWYSKAADHGFALANNALASLYEIGNGVVQNRLAALHLYQLAAEQGDSSAVLNLTRVYTIDGIADRAYFWGSVALHNSSHPQVLADLLSNLRIQLGNPKADRTDTEVAKWLQTHPRHSDGLDLAATPQPNLGNESHTSAKTGSN